MNPAAEPLTAFLRQQEPSKDAIDPTKPQVTFPSVLSEKISLEDEQQMVQWFLAKYRKAVELMGREHVRRSDFLQGQNHAGDVEAVRSHLGKRALYDKIAAMDLDWRKSHIGGLWEESNDHIPIVKRQLTSLESKAFKALFSGDNWVSFNAIGPDDKEKERPLETLMRWALSVAKTTVTLRAGVRQAFRRGEGVAKVGWLNRTDYYETRADVAINPEDGKPWVAEDGDFLYRQDHWVPGTILDPVSGADVQTIVLKRDGKTQLPEGVASPADLVRFFQSQIVPKLVPVDDRLDISIVPPEDFIIDPKAASIQEADFCGQLVDVPALQLLHQHVERTKAGDPKASEIHPRLMDLLNSLGNETGSVSSIQMPRPDLGEVHSIEGDIASDADRSVVDAGSTSPKIPVLEAYGRYTFADGIERQVVCMINMRTQQPIHYNYLRNWVPDEKGRRPFFPIRAEDIDNRWHGMSIVEFLWRLNWALDVMVNRINYADMRSGTVVGLDPTGCDNFEGMESEEISVNGGDLLLLRSGRRLDEVLQSKPLTEVDQATKFKMLQLYMQVAQNLIGQASTSDNQTAGLETADLKYGIQHLEQMGEQLVSPMIQQLAADIGEIVEYAASWVIDRMPDEQVIELTKGDKRMEETILKSQVADLRYSVKIALTSMHQEAKQATTAQAIGFAERLAAMLPDVRPVIAPLFEDMMRQIDSDKGLEVIRNLMATPEQTEAPSPISDAMAGGAGLPS